MSFLQLGSHYTMCYVLLRDLFSKNASKIYLEPLYQGLNRLPKITVNIVTQATLCHTKSVRPTSAGSSLLHSLYSDKSQADSNAGCYRLRAAVPLFWATPDRIGIMPYSNQDFVCDTMRRRSEDYAHLIPTSRHIY